jgi:hypothetical protein
MKRFLTSAMMFVFIAGLGSGIASAKSCRDAKGKFVKCPPAAMMAAPKRCRDAKGKFMKCKPAPMMKH